MASLPESTLLRWNLYSVPMSRRGFCPCSKSRRRRGRGMRYSTQATLADLYVVHLLYIQSSLSGIHLGHLIFQSPLFFKHILSWTLILKYFMISFIHQICHLLGKGNNGAALCVQDLDNNNLLKEFDTLEKGVTSQLN